MIVYEILLQFLLLMCMCMRDLEHAKQVPYHRATLPAHCYSCLELKSSVIKKVFLITV